MSKPPERRPELGSNAPDPEKADRSRAAGSARSAGKPASKASGAAAKAADSGVPRAARRAVTVTWSGFVGRVVKILLRPIVFWREIQDEEMSVRQVMFPHMIALIAVRSVAGFIGSLLQGHGLGAATGELLTSFLSWFALVWAFAAVAGSVASTSGGRLSANDSLRFAAYALVPFFVVGIFAAIPLPHVAPIAELVAMPYAFYVLALGVEPLLGVPAERSAVVTGQLCGALLVLWSIMPTLLPGIVKAVTT